MLNQDIKISIIVPAYNLEDYIEKSLMSIMNQTYRNLEIIVVNDGSRDNTGKIIDELATKDSRIIPIHQENKGVFFTRLVGIKNATGEWIGFVDGDDLIESNMYEILARNAMGNNVEISHCGYKMIYPDRIEYYHNTGQKKLQNNFEGIKDLMSGEFVEPGLWNKIYKKDLFDSLFANPVFNEKISFNEDLLMNYYLFKKAKVSIFYDKCLYNYVLRSSSATKSSINIARLRDPLKVIQIIKSDYDKNDEIKKIINERYIRQFISIVTCDISSASDNVKNYVKQIKLDFKSNISDILTIKTNKKIRLLAYWSCYSSRSYRFVHTMYAKIKGIDKKYKL